MGRTLFVGNSAGRWGRVDRQRAAEPKPAVTAQTAWPGRGAVRPLSPPLTALLHKHLERFGAAGDGRLFRNLAGGSFRVDYRSGAGQGGTEEEYRLPLARRRYDLRHAGVTRLAGACRLRRSLTGPGARSKCGTRSCAKVLAGLSVRRTATHRTGPRSGGEQPD